ncbi:MAG: ABC transporter permease [Dethiobacter sp.]|jgi:putative ABC transport system permease protein|nr:ABC transporter permease [Dethiobacter sp.]
MKNKAELSLNAFTLVLRTVAVNKKRCLFAVLGIIIGVAAVTTLVSMGYSAQRALANELEKLGTNILIVEAARASTGQGRGGQGSTVKTLSESDIGSLTDEVEGIAAAVPVLQLQGEIKSGANVVKTSVLATRDTFAEIRGLTTADGRLFLEEEDAAARRVILLGKTVAERLFDVPEPVGEIIRVNNVLFEIVGILSERGLDSNGEDQDDFVIVPLTTAQRRLTGEKYLTHIYIRATDTESIPAVKEGITAVLRIAHRLGESEPADFNILDQTELLEARTDILGSVEDLVGILAVVVLLAGGLGITAVQLISIRERTWEIGLHRAFGARKKDITIQFLFEAAILGGIGGLAGAVLGLITPLAVAVIFSLEPAIAWPTLFISLIISVMIGIAAGLYPALYASRLDPVVALRSA